MRTILLFLLSASPLVGQTTWIVDGSASVPGYHDTSISGLLVNQSVVAGDQIRVKGLKHNGLFYGYTDSPTVSAFPTQGSETWPISLPEGTSILPYDSTPVFVFPTNSTTSPIIDIGSPASSFETVIQGLVLVGGPVGIRTDMSASHTRKVRVAHCTFVLNGIAVSAVSTGSGTVDLTSTGCKIMPDNGLLSHLTIAFDNPNLGFRLHAESAGQAPRVEASISGLDVLTGFTLQPTPSGTPWNYKYGSSWPDLEAAYSLAHAPARVIDVYSAGDTAEHVGGGTQPIPEVVADISGCRLIGEPGGWDIGVYAATEYMPAGVTADYNAGYRVTITGCKVEDFPLVGIYGTAGLSARGGVWVHGGTSVTGTGSSQVHTATNPAYSGIHGYSYEGMLAVVCDGISSNDNRGSGIHLFSPVTRAAPGPHPVGLHARIVSSDFHGNSGCGISMSAGMDYVAQRIPRGSHAIVGGTWEETGPGSAVITLNGSGDGTLMPSGQGSIDRCAISNNGEFGIAVTCANPTPLKLIANCRITNTFIWSNPFGAFWAQTGKGTPQVGQQGLYILTPLVHCTFTGNGDALTVNPYNSAPPPSTQNYCDHTVEFYENLFAFGPQTEFEWDDPVLGAPDYATVVFNCIFDRGGPGPDLGPIADVIDVSYPAGPLPIPTATPKQIRYSGTRAVLLGGAPAWPHSTNLAPPMLGLGA